MYFHISTKCCNLHTYTYMNHIAICIHHRGINSEYLRCVQLSKLSLDGGSKVS